MNQSQRSAVHLQIGGRQLIGAEDGVQSQTVADSDEEEAAEGGADAVVIDNFLTAFKRLETEMITIKNMLVEKVENANANDSTKNIGKKLESLEELFKSSLEQQT